MSEHPTSIDLTTPRPPPDPVDGASAPVPAGEVTPEYDMVPRCGVCLCDVVETGKGADTATWYPCCRAATHIQCMVQCAGLHGSCPNCRAPLTDWITPSELERACSVAGVPTEPVPTTPRDTTHTIVNDYAARTFSMADLPEPPPPRATRALCWNRLAAPAMGFCELPDRTMTWAPVPTRGPEGIVAWHGQWLCQRCHREVRTPPEQTVPPCPTPACPTCGGAPVWEIDCRLATSRWACQTCQRDITTTAAPAPLVTDYRQRGPPVVPLQAPTFSCVYVPLLLAAVGALRPDAAQQWQASATMGPLWRMALNTLRATPFVRARHVGEALLHMVAIHGEGFLAAGPPQALATWVRQHGDDTITLPVAVGLTAAPEEGFYIPAPLQELLLTLWLGTAAASQLEQALTALRPQPTAPPTAAAPPTVEDATTTTAVAPPAPRPARRGGRGRGRGRGRCQPTDTDPALSTPRPEPPHATAPQPRAAGAAQLDAINLVEALGQRVYTFQAVPGRIRGAYRVALRQGLAMINDRATPQAESRGWKLFFLVSRMLLYRSPGQPQVPTQELDRRVALFERGDWATLLHDAHRAAVTPARPPTGTVSIEARADRATALAHLGELSAASRALTAEPLAPGTMATLAELQNPHLRPQQAYPLHTAPPTPHESTAVELPKATLLAALRTARRGAAAGPSGVTNEHLRLVLTDAEEIRLLHGAAVRFARANIPPDILQAVRQGRMVALRKPNGSVRALVVGDIFRRLVSKALARHYAAQLQEACLPFQFGLSSRAGVPMPPNSYRNRPPRNDLIVGCPGRFLTRVQTSHARGPASKSCPDPIAPLRPHVVWNRQRLPMGGRTRNRPHHYPKWGRGTGRPPHACPFLAGLTPRARPAPVHIARGRSNFRLPRRFVHFGFSATHPYIVRRIGGGTVATCAHRAECVQDADLERSGRRAPQHSWPPSSRGCADLGRQLEHPAGTTGSDCPGVASGGRRLHPDFPAEHARTADRSARPHPGRAGSPNRMAPPPLLRQCAEHIPVADPTATPYRRIRPKPWRSYSKVPSSTYHWQPRPHPGYIHRHGPAPRASGWTWAPISGATALRSALGVVVWLVTCHPPARPTGGHTPHPTADPGGAYPHHPSSNPSSYRTPGHRVQRPAVGQRARRGPSPGARRRAWRTTPRLATGSHHPNWWARARDALPKPYTCIPSAAALTGGPLCRACVHTAAHQHWPTNVQPAIPHRAAPPIAHAPPPRPPSLHLRWRHRCPGWPPGGLSHHRGLGGPGAYPGAGGGANLPWGRGPRCSQCRSGGHECGQCVGRWTPHWSRGQWPPSLPWSTAGNRCHLHQPHLPGRSPSPWHTHRPRTGGPTRGATQTPAVPRVNCRALM